MAHTRQRRNGLDAVTTRDLLRAPCMGNQPVRGVDPSRGDVRGETIFPLKWSDPSHRSLGHLVPDIVVFSRSSVHVVDAKYKAHLAELDEHGWHRFTDDAREAHRADIHQVLAYASLYACEEVHASLVYLLRRATFEALAVRGRDRSVADLLHGGRRVRLELRGVPFGDEHGARRW